MAFATTPAEPGGGFRPSMLIYDTRFRSVTLQVVALVLFLLLLGWLADNVISNLAAKGKDINFGFLWVRAGYDIEQTLIPYTNDSPHGRAVIIGLLNTLVIAFLGCILATLLGIIVGVLRLSNNWLIARLMTVYVEMFRNIPVLLWILLVFVVISETMPAPNEFKVTQAMLDSRLALEGLEARAGTGFFQSLASVQIFSMPFLFWLIGLAGLCLAGWQFARARSHNTGIAIAGLLLPALLWLMLGATLFRPYLIAPPVPDAALEAIGPTEPAASLLLFDTIALTNRGTNIPAPLLARPLGESTLFADSAFAALPVNWSLVAVLAVLALSIAADRRLRRRARAIQEETGKRPATWWASLAILFLPVIMLLWALGLSWELPHFPVNEQGVSQGFNLKGGIQVMHSFTALLIALSLYTSAFIAEIVRAGIQAVSGGQSEAAAALGLRPGRTMKLVILPQALRVIIPPLISQWLNLTKNTSLGIAVSYLDLRGTLGGITLNQTGRELECMLLMMLIYLTISLIISAGMNLFNRAVRLKER
ncbi:amino acid ABC transporter permease [Pseudogemmobacter faecipullorum]|uniref:ABC transporter permease subunit n=1 Tax=Pseudogemmobacter faecipullorum TaxID=2755041 RepID=A0ABS8CI70_9RHOB|nr:ABC transporter permease subunit [Pseudogemmobacter faecipullorum]MCB5409083.1 ABC transporter permease subunit [Pseudogemmobacter faecipullorum]